MARVVFRDGQGQDGTLDLSPGGTVVIGRGLDCAIRTDDAMVSRRHSLIRHENGRFVVEDMGSANGTLVNNERIKQRALAHNDVVQCGSLWLRFFDEGTPARPAKPSLPPAVSSGVPVQAVAPASAGGAPGAKATASPSGLPFGGPPSVPKFETGLHKERKSDAEVDAALSRLSAAGHAANGSQTARELEELQSKFEREVADGKRVRAELQGLRDRLDAHTQQLRDRDEQIVAHTQTAEGLRAELADARRELAEKRAKVAEVDESSDEKERRLQRALSDFARLREAHEEQARLLLESTRTKDDGWAKLNDQMGELDRLRNVIHEQERMLEERRVGLITQEELIKELRADKERSLKAQAQLKAERDEARAMETRLLADVHSLQEETRRINRLVQEAQGEAQGGPSLAGAAELRQLHSDLATARTELERAAREIAATKLALAEASEERLRTDPQRPASAPALGLATEVYEAVNDAVSAVRNNVRILQAELPGLVGPAEKVDIATNATNELVELLDGAKSALRRLRKFIEGEDHS